MRPLTYQSSELTSPVMVNFNNWSIGLTLGYYDERGTGKNMVEDDKIREGLLATAKPLSAPYIIIQGVCRVKYDRIRAGSDPIRKGLQIAPTAYPNRGGAPRDR